MPRTIPLARPTSIRLSPPVHEGLSRLAAAEGNPPSAIARRLLAQGVRRELRRLGQNATEGGADRPAQPC